MKLVLSRKGFDSQYGGCASPIHEDTGAMLSLPIPLAGASHKMRDALASVPEFAAGDIVADLTKRKSLANRRNADEAVHFDPCLRPRGDVEWRAALGQDGGAQGHLRQQSVQEDDLFLFFGWFRRVRRDKKGWRYVSECPDLHVLFGWLQVGKIFAIEDGFELDDDYKWLSGHPHLCDRRLMADQNTIYVARDRLDLDGNDFGASGGGAFGVFQDCLQLTARQGACGRSDWQLPAWFHPGCDGTPALSHHGKLWRWNRDPPDSPFTRLRTVAKGQEFVIDLEGAHKANALSWLKSLFGEIARNGA